MPAIQIIPENADFEPSLRDLSPNQHGRLGPPKFSNKSPPTTDNSFAVDRLGKAACSGAVSIREVVPTWIRTSILRPSLRSTGCLSEEGNEADNRCCPPGSACADHALMRFRKARVQRAFSLGHFQQLRIELHECVLHGGVLPMTGIAA